MGTSQATPDENNKSYKNNQPNLKIFTWNRLVSFISIIS